MMSAGIFKRQVDAKQADYDADQAAKDAQPDPDATKLDALNQALQKLLPNGDVPADGDVTDAKTAYAVLTKKLYPDDGHDPNNSDTSNDGTTASPTKAPTGLKMSPSRRENLSVPDELIFGAESERELVG